jgi:hypothetical protein
MPIHRIIKYVSAANLDNCADCSANPTLATDIVQSTGGNDLIVKHDDKEVSEIHIIHSAGATGSFMLAANFGAVLNPRLNFAKFKYTGTGNQVEPTGGGLVWSRPSNALNLTFHPLEGGESEGVWFFDENNQPPIKLRVVVKRKASTFTCP